MSVAICLYPWTRRNCFSATNSPDPTQRSRWSLPCQRFTFRQTRSTIENADSITLVLAIVLRSFIGTWRRCTVSVSSIPSPRLRAALGLRSISFAMQFVQRLLGGGVIFQSVGCVQFLGQPRFLLIGQMVQHIPPLVDLAALDRHR